MSEKVARLAVKTLRNYMFGSLPKGVQDLFPKTQDPLIDPEQVWPNIVVGSIQDVGAGVKFPIVTVNSSGAAEPLVRVFRHLSLYVDIWVGGEDAGNIDGRRIISIIYEHVFKTLAETNWSGDSIQIERCYEIERSPIMFDPQNKTHHIANVYKVEALSSVWF